MVNTAQQFRNNKFPTSIIMKENASNKYVIILISNSHTVQSLGHSLTHSLTIYLLQLYQMF
jgi:hypothetical protein